MGKTLSITLAGAYEAGRDNGYGIGECNRADYHSMIELWPDERFDKYMSDCSLHESDGFRQFSPFEFLANDLNNHPWPDEAWERYEHGVRVGLRQAWRKVAGHGQ